VIRVFEIIVLGDQEVLCPLCAGKNVTKLLSTFSHKVKESFQVQRNLPAVLVAPPIVIPVAHCEKVFSHRILSSARCSLKYGGSMEIKEITLEKLDAEKFIAEKIEEISSTIGNGVAINALSGGVDSSVVTILGHKALGDRFKTYFIDNALMREGEPQYIVSIFKDLEFFSKSNCTKRFIILINGNY